MSSQEMKDVLGDPAADDTTPEGRKARFANLGAVGPDVFYAMADYGGDTKRQGPNRPHKPIMNKLTILAVRGGDPGTSYQAERRF